MLLSVSILGKSYDVVVIKENMNFYVKSDILKYLELSVSSEIKVHLPLKPGTYVFDYFDGNFYSIDDVISEMEKVRDIARS